MKYKALLGFPVCAGSFLIAAAATNQVADGIIPIIAGGAAAFAAFRWLHALDSDEYRAASQPQTGTYQSSYPNCWGCVKDAIHSTRITVGRTISSWQVFHEDEHRGFIQAQIHFEEQVVAGTNPLSVPVVIFCVIRLEPMGDTTRVTREYDIRSGRIDTAHNAIGTIERALQQYLSTASAPPVSAQAAS